MRTPTIRDVAKKAGVGIGTVSRVLNNHESVSPKTRQRVLDAIDTLGFRPNRMAQLLSRGTRIQNLGVIMPHVTHHSFFERLRGIRSAIKSSRTDYELVLYNVSSPERYNDQLISIAEQGLVSGLLIIDLWLSNEQQRLLTDAGLKYAGINGHGHGWATFQNDDERGGYIATKHLINLGHRRIAYVGDEYPDEYGFLTSEQRHAGYMRALTEAKIDAPAHYSKLGEYGQLSAKELTAELLRHPKPPTAIFAMSDIQAIGCMAAIREAGLFTPQDISVIGYDDIELSEHLGLTTVRQHLEEKARLAMEYLLALLRGDADDTEPPIPPLKVMERGTTCAPRDC